jgi:site-specific recombinase XerD
VLERNWCKLTERVKGNNQTAESINLYLNNLFKSISDLYVKFRGLEINFNLLVIKDEVFSTVKTSKCLLKESSRGFNYISSQYLIDISEKDKAGIITHGTFKCYRASLNSLLEFVNINRVGACEIDLKTMDKEYFYRFENFLLTKKKMNKNSTHKVLKHTKRMFTYAFNNGWTTTLPEIWFNVKYVNPTRPLLTLNEVKVLLELKIEEPYLIETLDCFIFQIFSGLSYRELKSLNTQHLKFIDDRYWIIIKRKKTGNEQKLILLPEAIKVINKYKLDQACKNANQLLPVKSNQKYNENLKTVQKIAGINTTLTSHLGRHVFATTIALSNGMPLETVSKILGHSSLKTTQIYAKVWDDKIALDFDALSSKLAIKI